MRKGVSVNGSLASFTCPWRYGPAFGALSVCKNPCPPRRGTGGAAHASPLASLGSAGGRGSALMPRVAGASAPHRGRKTGRWPQRKGGLRSGVAFRALCRFLRPRSASCGEGAIMRALMSVLWRERRPDRGGLRGADIPIDMHRGVSTLASPLCALL